MIHALLLAAVLHVSGHMPAKLRDGRPIPAGDSLQREVYTIPLWPCPLGLLKDHHTWRNSTASAAFGFDVPGCRVGAQVITLATAWRRTHHLMRLEADGSLSELPEGVQLSQQVLRDSTRLAWVASGQRACIGTAR